MHDDIPQDDASSSAEGAALLSAPFAEGELGWRVLEHSPDGERVRLAAQPSSRALLSRLDAAFGVFGWSSRYQLHDAALCCELRAGGASRSVLRAWNEADAPEQLAHEALVGAAVQFGLVLPEDVWQDVSAHIPPQISSPAPLLPPPAQEPEKSVGQQAIDRVLERLREEGRGLEAAHLINTYRGYGADKEAARELYGQLRALLRNEAKPSA